MISRFPRRRVSQGNDAALASDLVRLMLNSNTSVQAMAAFGAAPPPLPPACSIPRPA